ncbi:signal recognition particle-docking protein FtsY [Pseudoramibacter alactolyticus]
MASLYQRMKDKLAGTKKNFSEKINRALYYKNLDEDFFDELEESLILSDMSIETSEAIIDQLQKEIKQKGIKKSEEVLGLLESIMTEMVTVTAAPMQMPAVMLVVGVNGVGKTTTIAKLAQRYKNDGKTVMLAAADTFRAAAAEQLKAWAERIGVDIIASASGADPASVVYDALHAAHSRHADVLICDTAGRLHNKVNLMNELEKLSRIIDREGQGFDVHNLLVVDATTGQNALTQARTFNEVVHLSGIVMTKMDGTAKGGVVIPMINELKIPVEYVGLGEGADDLVPFDAREFVKLLYDTSDSGA